MTNVPFAAVSGDASARPLHPSRLCCFHPTLCERGHRLLALCEPVVVAPLAGPARESPERFEYEPAHSALRRILRHDIEFNEVRKVERRELRPIGMILAVRFKIGHAALHNRRYKLAE
jgi:hypothetical protein